MSDSVISITHRHGREMYILGLEHALAVIQMADNATEILREQIEKEKKELEDERARQV